MDRSCQHVIQLLSCVVVTLCSNVQLAFHEFLMHLYRLDDVSAATAMVMLHRVIHTLNTALYVSAASL